MRAVTIDEFVEILKQEHKLERIPEEREYIQSWFWIANNNAWSRGHSFYIVGFERDVESFLDSWRKNSYTAHGNLMLSTMHTMDGENRVIGDFHLKGAFE